VRAFSDVPVFTQRLQCLSWSEH